VAVAVLGVGADGHVVAISSERVVLLGDVLGEVGRNHLLELLGCVPLDKGVLIRVLSRVYLPSMAHAAGKSLVVVASQQGGVGV
jgi:hypothetical protein